MVYVALNGQIKDNNRLFDIPRDSEFLMFSSNLNQSFKVEGKKE